jgi:DNA-binding transcriptional regulator YhcF (GntR family)
MREKNFSTGLRGVLFEAQHYARMGSALWLYGWLVLRQTHQSGSIGWVLGGAPVRYREIEEETGFNRRTLERWLSTLRREGYIETTVAQEGVRIRITKAKKFPQGARKSAEGVRKVAGSGTQNCGASTHQNYTYEQLADGMNSSSIVRIKERDAQRGNLKSCGNLNQNRLQDGRANQGPRGFESPNQHPSGLEENQNQNPNQFRAHKNQEQYLLWELRLRQQLLRAEREEATRRELAVGAGPLDRR